MSNTKHAALFIHALTGLHPGSGTALGVVDLPVQRERHTQWPVIPGSTLKGILRDTCRRQVSGDNGNPNEDAGIKAVFGPPVTSASDHAGALAVTDARILAFPVRSLYGVFAWITCPAVLKRLQRDLRLIGERADFVIPDPVSNETTKQACAPSDCPCRIGGKQIILEEYEFMAHECDGSLGAWIAQRLGGNAPDFEKRLIVLHDDDFTYFVRYATEVVARIGLDYKKKTVAQGALFYEEYIPAETIFYSLVIANAARDRLNGQAPSMDAAGVLAYLQSKLIDILQIGAGETIGKGLCAVNLATGKD